MDQPTNLQGLLDKILRYNGGSKTQPWSIVYSLNSFIREVFICCAYLRFYKSPTKQNRPTAAGWAVVPHRNERSEMTRSTTNSRNNRCTKLQNFRAPKPAFSFHSTNFTLIRCELITRRTTKLGYIFDIHYPLKPFFNQTYHL